MNVLDLFSQKLLVAVLTTVQVLCFNGLLLNQYYTILGDQSDTGKAYCTTYVM